MKLGKIIIIILIFSGTLDLVASKTIDYKGAKYVSVETSNSEKLAYTVCLSGFSNGMKLPPLIIFNGKGSRISKTLNVTSSEFVFSGNESSSYMTEHSDSKCNLFTSNTSDSDLENLN